MIKKLYRKLYIYAVAIIFASIGLTILIFALVFHRDEMAMRHQYLTRQGSFAQYIISQTPHPLALPMQIDGIGSFLRWRITYWQGHQVIHHYGKRLKLPSKKYLNRLSLESPVIYTQNGHDRLLTYLNPLYPSAGYLVMAPPNKHPLRALWKNRRQWMKQLNYSPFLFGALIFVFLAVLLIPYSRFIIRPFKELNASIERVADGDFSQPVQVSSKSEFGGIADAFNNMVEKLKAMFNQKQRLIADVSHELRSPLTRMRLSLEMLSKEGKGNPKYINRSIQELEQLDRMIEDLLDASSLELDKTRYPLGQLDLSELLKLSLESHQLFFDSHGLAVETEIDDLPNMIEGNPELLQRAFNNLFSNISKYAPENSRVNICLASNGQGTVLTVRDRGPGVSSEEQEKIFEPFYRTDDSRCRKTGGTGLGLAIVKQIMNHHKGSIAASTPTDGEGGLKIELKFSA